MKQQSLLSVFTLFCSFCVAFFLYTVVAAPARVPSPGFLSKFALSHTPSLKQHNSTPPPSTTITTGSIPLTSSSTQYILTEAVDCLALLSSPSSPSGLCSAKWNDIRGVVHPTQSQVRCSVCYFPFPAPLSSILLFFYTHIPSFLYMSI